MKKIALSQGQFSLVDDADFEWLNQWKWFAHWSKFTKSYYAGRNGKPGPDGKRRNIWMSRLIMDAPSGVLVDHRDHETLNNQRGNLRLASHSQNAMNARKRRNATSKFKGVYLRVRKWAALIGTPDGKQKYLGSFDSEIDAAETYRREALVMYGEFSSAESHRDHK